VLAIEAGRTVILDREEVFALAKESGVSIVGIAGSGWAALH